MCFFPFSSVSLRMGPSMLTQPILKSLVLATPTFPIKAPAPADLGMWTPYAPAYRLLFQGCHLWLSDPRYSLPLGTGSDPCLLVFMSSGKSLPWGSR